MREDFGHGWVDRGPRSAVAVWDDDMQSCKGEKDIDSRLFGYTDDYSEESTP